MRRLIYAVVLILTLIAGAVAAGNAAPANGISLTSDREDRPVVTGPVTSQYNYLGQRAWRDFAGKRTYYVYDGDQRVVEIEGSGQPSPGSAWGTYCFGAMGLVSRLNNDSGVYEEFIFDPWGSPLQRWPSNQTAPIGNMIYDARGKLQISRLRSTGGTIGVEDPIGALSQWGDFTDEELRASQNDLVLHNAGIYDPSSIRTAGRGGGLNEYQADLLPFMLMEQLGTGALQSVFGEEAGQGFGLELLGSRASDAFTSGQWNKAKELMRFTGLGATSVLDMYGATGAGHAIRPGGGFVSATETAVTELSGLRRSRAFGRIGEDAAGVAGPKVGIRIPSSGRVRFPDFVNNTVLKEVKNVNYQALTRQLRDYMEFSRERGLMFELWLRPNTKVSRSLQKAIDLGNIVRRTIGGG